MAELGEPRARRRIGERIHDRRVEACGDRLRRAFRRPDRVPHRGVEARHAGLLRRRHVRQRRQTALAGVGIDLDVAGADLRQRSDLVGDRKIDLARDQVLHGGRAAAIVCELEARAGGVLEQDTEDVVRAAGAGGARGGLVRVRLQPGDQLAAARSAAGSSCRQSSCELSVTSATGSKSFSTSYCSEYIAPLKTCVLVMPMISV